MEIGRIVAKEGRKKSAAFKRAAGAARRFVAPRRTNVRPSVFWPAQAHTGRCLGDSGPQSCLCFLHRRFLCQALCFPSSERLTAGRLAGQYEAYRTQSNDPVGMLAPACLSPRRRQRDRAGRARVALRSPSPLLRRNLVLLRFPSPAERGDLFCCAHSRASVFVCSTS